MDRDIKTDYKKNLHAGQSKSRQLPQLPDSLALRDHPDPQIINQRFETVTSDQWLIIVTMYDGGTVRQCDDAAFLGVTGHYSLTIGTWASAGSQSASPVSSLLPLPALHCTRLDLSTFKRRPTASPCHPLPLPSHMQQSLTAVLLETPCDSSLGLLELDVLFSVDPFRLSTSLVEPRRIISIGCSALLCSHHAGESRRVHYIMPPHSFGGNREVGTAHLPRL